MGIKLPSASTTKDGIVSNGTQTIAGDKTFTGNTTQSKSGSSTFLIESTSIDAILNIRSTGGGGTAVTWKDSTTANTFSIGAGALTSVNQLEFVANSTLAGKISATGAWTLGPTSGTANITHQIYNNSTTNAPAQFINLNTSTSSDGVSAIQLSKGSTTNTTAQKFIEFYINERSTASGQINANGASQVAFGSFSDERLKENIQNLPNQLEKIMLLRPVEFDYKDGSGHQIGFIAQEMHDVYPDAVSESRDGMLQITGFSKTEARLIKAIQELKEELDEAKQRITQLENA